MKEICRLKRALESRPDPSDYERHRGLHDRLDALLLLHARRQVRKLRSEGGDSES